MKYVTLYAKVIDDKNMGMLMVGVYLGGVAETMEEAERIAEKCVDSNPNAIIIPKIFKYSDHSDIRELAKLGEAQFDKLAESMYENEKI